MLRANPRITRAKKIPIDQVLADLGYRVHVHAGDREQQFSCDLHGDGTDTKQSARVYPQSNSVYCFACNQVRDAISLVMGKRGLRFWEAVVFLEQKYDLPYLAQTDNPVSVMSAVGDLLKPPKSSVEDQIKGMQTSLRMIGKERVFDLCQITPLWEALDKITYLFHEEKLSPIRAKEALSLLHTRFFDILKETQENAYGSFTRNQC